MSHPPGSSIPDISTEDACSWLMSEMTRLWGIGPKPGEIELLSELYFILSDGALSHEFRVGIIRNSY